MFEPRIYSGIYEVNRGTEGGQAPYTTRNIFFNHTNFLGLIKKRTIKLVPASLLHENKILKMNNICVGKTPHNSKLLTFFGPAFKIK